jgi:glutamate racemase
VSSCPGFVEFVERGQTEGDEVLVLAERLLAPVVAAGVDALLLGCTHYPFLARTIGEVMGQDVVLVSSADETAFAVRDLLDDTGLARAGSGAAGSGAAGSRAARHTFLSSGDVRHFAELGGRLLGPELAEARSWSAVRDRQ